MPRKPRLLLSKSCYHIMTRGNNKNIVFKDHADYLYYLKLLRRYKLEHEFELFHYCLMPTHVHMLVRTKKSADFSQFMKKINLAYFHYFRQKYGWVGHFWQDRFKSQPVGKDEYFIQCGKYIELNPVRKELVDQPENWPYSSYGFYIKGESNNLLTDDFIYKEIGDDASDRQKKYREIFIDELIVGEYKNHIWGVSNQRYKEKEKETKCFSRRNIKKIGKLKKFRGNIY